MITRAQVWATFEEIVSEVDPGYQDSHDLCEYTYADGSHCLVGEILTRLGYSLPLANHRLNTRTLPTLALEMLYPIELDALDLLSQMQELNDVGLPWSSIAEHLTAVSA